MKLLLAALCLAGCATAEPLEQAFQAVNARAYTANYQGWDKRILQPGDKGNCAPFAHSYQHEAAKHGIPLIVTACTLKGGDAHAFAVTADGSQALDVRQRSVVPFSHVGCQ